MRREATEFYMDLGCGLRCPVRMGRGIRQGYPLSGQLYSLAIEPLLCLLRAELHGLSVRGVQEKLVLSAYAGDVTVFLKKIYQKPG